MCFAAFGLSPSINSPWFTVIPCVSRVLLLSVPFCRILFAVIICCITLTLSAYRYSPTIASTFKLTVAVAPFLSHIPDGVHVLPFYVIVPEPRFIPHPTPDACFPARVVRRPTPWVRDPPLPHTHLCLRECPLDCIFVTRLFTGEPSPTHMHDYLQLHTYPHPLPRPEAYKYTRSIRVTVAPGRCPAAPSSRSTIHDSRPSRLHTTHLHLHHYWHNCSRVPCRFRARYGLPTPATPAFAARCALRTTVASRAHHSDDGVPPPRGTRRNFTGRRSRPLALPLLVQCRIYRQIARARARRVREFGSGTLAAVRRRLVVAATYWSVARAGLVEDVEARRHRASRWLALGLVCCGWWRCARRRHGAQCRASGRRSGNGTHERRKKE